MDGKLIIFSAPSGSGKTSIVKRLLKECPELEFSVSATSRKPRPGEKNGKHYYFLSPEEFRSKIYHEEFVEWEEVYKDHFYGTLKSELSRIWNSGKHVIFDVDVIGGLNLKKQFADQALSIYVDVPSFEELENRLRNRSTESEDIILKRLGKAQKESYYKNKFDLIILNDSLEKAVKETLNQVQSFLSIAG